MARSEKPKLVRTETLRVGAAHFRAEFYVSREGVFSCPYPRAVAEVVGAAQASGVTLDLCKGAWHDSVRRWEEAQATSSPVILYAIEMQGTLHTPPERDPTDEDDEHSAAWSGRCLLQRDDMTFVKGVGLALQCGVYRETVTKFKERTFYAYELSWSKIPRWFACDRPGSHNLQRFDGLLEWTLEREEWFAGLCWALQGLMLKLNDLTGTQEKLLDAISRGRLLPPGAL